jgi:hypothetical protein
MQSFNITNAQHMLSIIHQFLGFRKASIKEKDECLKIEMKKFICCNHCTKKKKEKGA